MEREGGRSPAGEADVPRYRPGPSIRRPIRRPRVAPPERLPPAGSASASRAAAPRPPPPAPHLE